MPRLLILCEFSTLLGGERSMLATLGPLGEAGFEAWIAAPPIGALADVARVAGARLANWPVHGPTGARRPTATIRGELGELVRTLAPDLVHANSLATARLAGPVLAAARMPSVGHLRDIVGLSRQAVADVSSLDRLIAVSEATRAFHIAQGIDAERCVVLNNGIDLERFRPQPATGQLQRELGISPRARLVITIGQIGLRKGSDVALAAARRWSALPDVHWVIVGERTSQKDEARAVEDALREAATRGPLAGRLHMLGTRDDVATLLADCALLVHAARQEPLGRVLLEAAACGVAVVATEVGGTREIFPTTASGAVLVPPDDAEALAAAVEALLTDEPRRLAAGHAGRARALAAFDIHHAAGRLIDLYRGLLSR